MAGDPACVLAVEFYVASEAEARARLDELRAQLARQGVRGAVVDVFDAAGQANVWAVRKAGLSLLLSKRGDVKPAGFMEDVAVPPEHLADYVRGVQSMFAEYGVEAAFYAHASAGCLHIRPLLNLKTAADIAVMDEMQSRLLAMIQPVGGVLSGEHGDGIKLTHLNQALFGPRVSEAFAQTKLLFDPDNLFNPGKKVPEEMLAEVGIGGQRSEVRDRNADSVANRVYGLHVTDPAELRYGPGYRTVEFVPLLDWSADGGFAGAVEMCNGSGDCRKLTGVMCPSFHATREEEHSTRGRANLLRTALSGQLDRRRLDQRRRARCAGFVPRLQGVQDRVSFVGGHGEDQDRDAGATLRTSRDAAGRAAVRPHPHAEPAGRARRTAGESGACHAARSLGSTASHQPRAAAPPAPLHLSALHHLVCHPSCRSSVPFPARHAPALSSSSTPTPSPTSTIRKSG